MAAPDVSNLIKLIEAIPTGQKHQAKHTSEAFETFVRFSLHLLWNGYVAMVTNKKAETGSTAFGSEPKGFYIHSSDLKYAPAKLLACTLALQEYQRLVSENEPFEDILVLVHAQMLAKDGGDGLGQFFTPPDAADLVAGITSRLSDDGQGSSVADECCGAGTMLMSWCKQRHQAAKAGKALPLKYVSVFGSDLDMLACEMTALQLWANRMMHNVLFMELRVTCGNTLTQNTAAERDLVFLFQLI